MCEAHRALYVRYIRTHHYVLLSCNLPVDPGFKRAKTVISIITIISIISIIQCICSIKDYEHDKAVKNSPLKLISNLIHRVVPF